MEPTIGDILAQAIEEQNSKPKTVLAYHTVLVFVKGHANKIEAIKQLRSFTGIGLREAKDCVENQNGIYMPVALFDLARDKFGAHNFLFTTQQPIAAKASRIFC
jgi:hypothetical protein